MKNTIKIRLDVDNPTGKKPKLVGLWMTGFGWIIGGSGNGSLILSGEIVANDPRTNLSKLRTFLRRVTHWNYAKEDLWPTELNS